MIDTNKSFRLIVAGGGTGGHLFPGIAIAEALMDINPINRILFLGTDRPLEKNILAQTPFCHESIPAGGLKGLNIQTKIKSLFQIPAGIVKAIKIYSQFSPHLVLGVGGYVSAPCVLAANLMGIPVILQEQNSIPGLANRLLGKTADRIYVSFPETCSWFKEKKTIYAGNPVRKSIVQASKNRSTKQNSRFTIFIIGGSQGAHAINNAMIDALPYLDNHQMVFIHQSGQQDEQLLKEAYQKNGFHADVRSFFHDMITQYQTADLIICRSGASTVAELTILGKPTIFIPFPYSADNHQEKNARAIVDAGGAEMILEPHLTGQFIAERICFLASHQESLEKMKKNSTAFGKPGAANQIALDCYKLSTITG
ncbi:MAG: undecaprenyldiphospho-muramoylpentapeptide beta-N-acetylglucosaminyltransferase [Candidatus Magnetomorum sp.]|nr:undecaprenyldiphospho-muramoylpentapeptide beta-N-acetylglucosaminyltransferase [Candidatus Magnetomorum sp.]